MRFPFPRAVALVALLVSATLAGCATQGPPASAIADAGHAMTSRDLQASALSLSGVSLRATSNATEWLLSENLTGLVEHRALLFHEATLDDGAQGVVIALAGNGTIRTRGALAYHATGVSMDADATRHVVTTDSARSKMSTHEMRERLEEMGFWADAFFGASLAVDASGPLMVDAARLVLVTASGARDLGTSATLANVGTISGTVETAAVVDTPRTTTFEIADRRGHLALADAKGRVALVAQNEVVPTVGSVVLTLGRGAIVNIVRDGTALDLDVNGRLFQLYDDGVAKLASELALRFDAAEVTFEDGGAREVAFHLVASDPHTDPVITSVRIEGAPEGTVSLPGYVPLTEQVFAGMGENPAMALATAPALPGLILADALIAMIDLFGGPARIPQAIEAGTTFSSRITVAQADAPYEVTLVFEGNFPTTRATLQVG